MKLALNEDICSYSYKCCRGQLLTEKACENRLTKGKKLLRKVKHPAEPQTIWFFSDEKNFCQHQKHIKQNNRWLAYCPKDTPGVMHTKFSQTVMVFGCVSCEGDVMPPYFFRQGLRLYSDAYVELLITVVEPWITRVGYLYGSRIRPPKTPLGKVKNGCWRIFTTTPFPMFGLRTPQILTLWIIMYGALLRKMSIAAPVLQKHS